MSGGQNLIINKLNGRPVGRTENSWCLASPGGTGIVVVAIALSKHPDTSDFQEALNKLQNSHPILRSRLHANPSTNSFSFITSPIPIVQVKTHNLTPTCEILKNQASMNNISPLQLVLEHELNENSWCKIDRNDLLFASIYALPHVNKWVVALRLNLAGCDRTTAASLCRELVALLGEKLGTRVEIEKKEEVNLGIEELIPHGKSKKGWLSRGVDMLSYSVNSLKLTNLKFEDTKSPRRSQVVRLQIGRAETDKILNVCNSRSIKISSVLTAAGLIAAHASSNQQLKTYGIATLTDCRSLLDPPLSSNAYGFYHSAILNTHVIKGRENLWDLAQKIYATFSHYKNCNKHFSDMADLTFLMCRAIANPGLTTSSSLRTAFMSVFEDPVVDNSDPITHEMGLEDSMMCASVHGIGPSIGVFDTIRDGKLDCIFVYPSPLHSRGQMEELVGNMKTLLLEIEA